ncbi:hypothetical protein OF83DRAFT_592900 [Amylostereum chailletii]|nr:hypothetical protein OF83DRAFT_592900 [Amylostereum chailletii]
MGFDPAQSRLVSRPQQLNARGHWRPPLKGKKTVRALGACGARVISTVTDAWIRAIFRRMSKVPSADLVPSSSQSPSTIPLSSHHIYPRKSWFLAPIHALAAPCVSESELMRTQRPHAALSRVFFIVMSSVSLSMRRRAACSSLPIDERARSAIVLRAFAARHEGRVSGRVSDRLRAASRYMLPAPVLSSTSPGGTHPFTPTTRRTPAPPAPQLTPHPKHAPKARLVYRKSMHSYVAATAGGGAMLRAHADMGREEEVQERRTERKLKGENEHAWGTGTDGNLSMNDSS